MNKEKISVKNLNVFFGDIQALVNVTVKIPENRVTAIIGPSGCGKTTFLRVLNRMNELIDGTNMTGEVLIEGVNIYSKNLDVAHLRKNIGMIFQKPNLFPKSVFENLVYGLKINGLKDEKKLEEIAEKTLVETGLWDEVKDRLNDHALSLSGGQQQRLCIARALAVEPQIILMDEPASALDPFSTAKIENLIYDLKKDYTIIMVTHNLQQAARISDNTAFFYLGKLIEFDRTSRMFTNPANKQTEDYITGRFG